MTTEEAILLRAGLPLAGAVVSAHPPPAPAELRRAMDLAASGALGSLPQEALHAWLRAFRSGWPSAFAEILGDQGLETEAALRAVGHDAGRLVKLGRIASEQLAKLY